MKKTIFALLTFLVYNLTANAQAGGYTPYWQIDSEQEKLLPSNAEQEIQLERISYIIFLEVIQNKSAKQEKIADELPELFVPLKRRKHFKELYLRKAESITDSSRVFVMAASKDGEEGTPPPLGEFVKVDKKLAKWVWKNPPEPGEYAIFLGTGDTIAYAFRIVESDD